ncbi:MAG: glycosyltransferase family 4 protein [Candidatus Latescibacteria bacterium]|nr:glycosyltransferase family 4 protein [Candidatus Latescibacterota bacterium]
MNLLVASHLYPSTLSRTAGSFVHNQARFLAALAQVRVVSPTPWFPPLPGFGRWSAYAALPRREELEGVEVERPPYLTFPRRVLLSQVWRFYLRALARGQRARPLPDLIHAHCAYPDGLAAVEYGRRLGRPVVITVHGHDLKDLPRNPRWRALVARALQNAQAVIAVSQELGRLAEGLGARRLRVIPNGVDCQLFKPGTRSPGAGGWRLLYVGRFDVAKGLGVLLEALARLRQHRRDLSLKLVGGNAATGTEAPFRAQVARLGLGECVEFAAEVPWQEVPRHMGEADVFVLPSFSEGLPLVLVEALACGLPLVATRCGGPEELVRAGVGQLVEVGEVEGLAHGIEVVLDHYAGYDRQAIRRRAEEEYDYRCIAARLFEVYEEVLKS